MKIKINLLLLASASIILFAQCKKEKNEDPAPTTTTTTGSTAPATITELFTQNGVQVQSGTALTVSSQTVSLSGVKIEIPANAFVTITGAPVTGTVDLAIKGIFTKKDIILSGAPANSSGKLIATKGCVKVGASQNSQTLRIAPGANVYVNVPEPGTTPVMNLKKFYAAQISITDTSKKWRPATDTAAIVPQFDSTTMKYYYPAKLDSVAWLNTGYEWDTVAAKTSVTIVLDSIYTATNCAVYISLNGKVVVGALYSQGMGYYSINNIPIGQNVKFVAISIIGGTYYAAYLPATITNGFSSPMTLQATTLSNIQAQLLLLP
ncbi:MAG: hypothetical protein Q8M29_13460 [Bacteroidota bacterium]|nr:hypothetical protein [Bacteroidota bacterium]